MSKRQCEHLAAVAYDSVRRRQFEEFWISTACGSFFRAQPNRPHLLFFTRVLVQSRSYRLSPRLLPKVHSTPPSSRWMLVVEDRVPRRTRWLWSDPVLAALTGVRSALAVAIAWPAGATAVIIVATACSSLAPLEQPVIATLALVRSDATHVPDDRELGIGLKYWSGDRIRTSDSSVPNADILLWSWQ
jgi:hypothetical protein